MADIAAKRYRHFQWEPHGTATVVHLADPKLLNASIVSELQDELIEFVDNSRPEILLIDFTYVTHSFTALIGCLLVVQRRLEGYGSQLKLFGMRDTVREAYLMLNLDGTVFDIRAEPSEIGV